MSRLTRIERRQMEAEYLLDSTVSHVRKKGCDDIRPRALGRIQKALNALRGAIEMTRLEQGVRHPTLFAGSAGERGDSRGRKQAQKAWGPHKVPHRWGKDCDADDDGREDDEVVEEEIGRGLEAECWFCDAPFVKEDYDEACGLWRCPSCGKCGCDLDDFTRQAIEKTYMALGFRDGTD